MFHFLPKHHFCLCDSSCTLDFIILDTVFFIDDYYIFNFPFRFTEHPEEKNDNDYYNFSAKSFFVIVHYLTLFSLIVIVLSLNLALQIHKITYHPSTPNLVSKIANFPSSLNFSAGKIHLCFYHTSESQSWCETTNSVDNLFIGIEYSGTPRFKTSSLVRPCSLRLFRTCVNLLPF